ncbi:MAG: LacI family transcriptional regulator, partial [Spirochaetales bacterium]|nr:LacI family transcriptional regulator [Spirochaetales bacterium]
MATLKDIAQAAGVSVRTVSRALYDSGYVQELKKKRILDLAREMHYRVDRKARGLRTGISYEITGVINNVGELTAAKIAASEKILRERGYMLNLLFISNLEEREDVTDILEEVSSRNPAGILLFNRPDRLIAKLEGNNLAMVAVDMDSAD